MADNNKGLVAAGGALVWRRQRLLWWVYAVNLALGVLGTAGARTQLEHLLKYSLAGESLSRGFDLGMFFELINVPSANLMRSMGSSVLFALLFPLFMLFVTGGILSVYRDDRRFAAGDFFAASGAFFWRFLRLAFFSLVPFGILAELFSGVRHLAEYLGDRATAAQTEFCILVAGSAVVVLLVLFVRLWFDIAQVRAVVADERRMWPNLCKALGITWRQARTLLRVYLCVSGVAWVTLAVGLFIWAKLPATATPATFLLLQFIVMMQLAARLWQRASAVTWYQRQVAMVPADTALFTTPATIAVVEAVPVAPESPAAACPQEPELIEALPEGGSPSMGGTNTQERRPDQNRGAFSKDEAGRHD
jgi:hypothetical protein